ncbi:helix-turn-helix domain-containing protein [Paenibacillus naphthalenovorans]|uniref:helix-turn-helix domain-containing protein n=1 Tax=Paenibacillus naphthalenovorans TaxID=162209 RepID=UPI003D279CA4
MKSPVHEVMTASEVDEIYGKAKGTTRFRCRRGDFGQDEARLALGTWLITKSAVVRVMGPPPERR